MIPFVVLWEIQKIIISGKILSAIHFRYKYVFLWFRKGVLFVMSCSFITYKGKINTLFFNLWHTSSIDT